MSNRKWIGAALGVALCSTALVSCSVKENGSGQSASPDATSLNLEWKSDTEKQLLDAIQQAPANGLKPDLFLKGGEKGAALTDAALKYASALANGYADPTQLHEVYTIPHPKVDVRPGLQQAIQKGDVKGWLDSLVPQTDEYRALSQAHLHYLQLASNSQFQPVESGKPIKPGSRDPRVAQVAAALRSVGYLEQPQPQQSSKPQAAQLTAPRPSIRTAG